MVWSIDIYYLK